MPESSLPLVRGAGGSNKSVLIIGAGIVGACCAAYLQREGHSVTLVDSEDPQFGASWGNAGALSPGSCIPLSTPGMALKAPRWLLQSDGPLVVRPRYVLQALPWLVRFVRAGAADRVSAIADSLRALHEPVFTNYSPILSAAGCEDLVRQTGSLVVYRSEAAYEQSAKEWAMRRERGATFELLGGKELQSLVPALSPEFTRAVLQPTHGYVCDPGALLHRLRRHVASGGGRYVRDRVVALEVGSGKVQARLASLRTLEADRVVIAAGAWSTQLLRDLGVSVPLETQRGYHMQFGDTTGGLALPVSFAEDKFYATPMKDGLRLA
ncbi:MAG: FAD-dependent oxidoreductase, partial [Desulfobacterales bacterium]|nr:FAD-dependent oxidoreductase [Desulfobacterales bacterium]